MKSLNLIFYFPLQWYQASGIKIKDEQSNWVGKIHYAQETQLDIPDSVSKLKFTVPFFKTELATDSLEESPYILIYVDLLFLLGMPQLKRLQVKSFESAETRNDFCNALYTKEINTKPVVEKNKATLMLGLLLSALLILTPFYPGFENAVHLSGSNQLNVVLIIGLVSFISLCMLFYDRAVPCFSYRDRLYASLFSFILTLFYIKSTTLFIPVFILSLVFFLRLRHDFQSGIYKELSHETK